MPHGDTSEWRSPDDEGKLVDQALMTLPFDELEIMDDWHIDGFKRNRQQQCENEKRIYSRSPGGIVCRSIEWAV